MELDLKKGEKETWKKRLVDAGEWTAAGGEDVTCIPYAVLPGILLLWARARC